MRIGKNMFILMVSAKDVKVRFQETIPGLPGTARRGKVENHGFMASCGFPGASRVSWGLPGVS